MKTMSAVKIDGNEVTLTVQYCIPNVESDTN